MAGKDDINEQAAEHIRKLDEHLEMLKRQNATLDSLAAEQEAEVAQLKRMLAEAAGHFGKREEPPAE
jgi:predicted RNase H-like nuclease (RuvC/YqgF family)